MSSLALEVYKKERIKIINQKEFHGERVVKYVLHEAKYNKKDLIIIFSAFPKIDKPPAYNFINVLKDTDANKLYILDDFGGRASYYLCQNKDFAIERSVIELIRKVKKDLNIINTIAVGSSKGGYASLYYGIKYGFNHIIAASPQFFVGNYLNDQSNSSDVTKFMVGGSSEEDKKFLNQLLPEVIFYSQFKPNIYIHLGKGEYHYTEHVLPMTKLLDYKGVDLEVDLGDYNHHNDVAIHFPSILIEKLNALLESPKISLVENNLRNNTFKIGDEVAFLVEAPKDCAISWYEYHKGSKVNATMYQFRESQYKLKFNKIGDYQVKVFVKGSNGRIKTILSSIYSVSE